MVQRALLPIDLPDIIGQIALYLEIFLDFIAFSSVSRNTRSTLFSHHIKHTWFSLYGINEFHSIHQANILGIHITQEHVDTILLSYFPLYLHFKHDTSHVIFNSPSCMFTVQTWIPVEKALKRMSELDAFVVYCWHHIIPGFIYNQLYFHPDKEELAGEQLEQWLHDMLTFASAPLSELDPVLKIKPGLLFVSLRKAEIPGLEASVIRNRFQYCLTRSHTDDSLQNPTLVNRLLHYIYTKV